MLTWFISFVLFIVLRIQYLFIVPKRFIIYCGKSCYTLFYSLFCEAVFMAAPLNALLLVTLVQAQAQAQPELY